MSEVRLKEVRSSLELTDGCIIDGDPETVTFAIKMQRSTLRANHHFLLAASEAATDWRPTFNDCSVKTVSHWGRRFAKSLPRAIYLASSLAFLAAAGVWGYYAIVPAVAFQSIVPDQATIAQGKPLIMVVSARHNRDCHITYHRTITRDSNGELVFSDNHPARHQGVSNGYETTTTLIPLPILPAGDYTLYIAGDFDCGTLDSRTNHVITTHFSITSE